MKLILQLGFLSIVNLGIGLLVQWYIFTRLGPGVETDALFAGMTIPQMVLAIVTGSLMHVLVPLLSGKEDHELRHDAWGFLILITGLFSALALLLYLTAPWWVPWSVPGFTERGLDLTIMLTRIQLVGMVFSAMNGVQWATYHAKQQFLWPQFIPMLTSILTLALLIWTLPIFGVIAAAWIMTLKLGLQSLLLMSGMGRPVRPNLRTPMMLEAWRRIKPLLLGTAYYKTDPVVDRFLLSTAATGSVSLYHFSKQIYGVGSQVINKAICVPLVPALSRLHKSKNMLGFRSLYYRSLLQLAVLSFVGMFVLVFFGQYLLNLLIGHGSVTKDNVIDLWWIMIWLSGSFVGGILGQVTSSSFYSIGDTSTPTRLGIYTYTFFFPVKLIIFYFFGVAGLALTTSIYFLISFVLQFHYFRSMYFSSFVGGPDD